MGSGNSKVDYNARLQHKQYLAQESPELIYDLSECGLKNVPSGVYSRCKVARKQALILNDNQLTSVTGGGQLSDLGQLQVLDLHDNLLEKLPDDLGQHLTNLTKLDLHNNKLKQLPSSLGDLTKLQSLNLSGNSLRVLPVNMSGLVSLTCLDLRHNPKLSAIPATLAQCRCLDTLLLDKETVSYPPPDIVAQGTEAVMRFLCQECDIDYINPSLCVGQINNSVQTNETNHHSSGSDPFDNIISEKLAQADRLKEEKRKQAMLFEQQRLEDEEKETQLKLQSAEDKKKLLDDIALEEERKTADVMRIQAERDQERHKLFSRMASAEQQTDLLINELMAASSRYLDPSKVMETLEAERNEMEARFTIHQQDVEKLKEKEVLRAMHALMEEDLSQDAARRQYEERQGVIQLALQSTRDSDKAIEDLLASKGKQQEALLAGLLEDEKYQRDAFQSLLLKQDHRCQEITDQMERIQNELGSLTQLEMKKRDLKVEFELEVLADKRDTLTRHLLELMEAKQKRAADLQALLVDMEAARSQEHENYWLIQYQKLLEAKPAGVKAAEAAMDVQVKNLLARIGFEKLIPTLAQKRVTFKELSYADAGMLRDWGVESEYACAQILRAVEQEAAAGGGGGSGQAIQQPSAPEAEDDDTAPTAPSAPTCVEAASAAPSAPVIETFDSSECVICLEGKCSIIFLPCGHLCCCAQCEADVKECPLCRSSVEQRVRLA